MPTDTDYRAYRRGDEAGDDLGEEEGDGCVLTCCSRLGRVPASGLTLLIVISVAVTTCCISVSLAAWRTRDLLQMHDEFQTFLPIWLGCTLGTFSVAILLLVIATASSNHVRKQQHQQQEHQQQKEQQLQQHHTWNIESRKTKRRKLCLSILNGFTIGLLVLLQSLWLLISVGLGAVLLTLRHWNIVQLNGGCIRLANYGLPVTGGPMCAKDLQNFYADLQKEEIFLKYFIGFISSTVVIPALSFYMIYSTSNLMKLDGIGVRGSKVNDNDVKVNDNEIKTYTGDVRETLNNDGLTSADHPTFYRTETPL